MAQYPCDICGLRYKGAQQTMYPALLHHAVSFRQRRRMCPVHFSEANDYLQEHMLPTDVLDQSGVCVACDSPQPELAFFCTVYALNEDRSDYYGYACTPCSLKVLFPLFFGPLAAAEAPFGP